MTSGQCVSVRTYIVRLSCAVFIRNKNSETAKDTARKFGRVDCLAVLGGDKGEESNCISYDS